MVTRANQILSKLKVWLITSDFYYFDLNNLSPFKSGVFASRVRWALVPAVVNKHYIRIPVLLISISFTIILKKEWAPDSIIDYIGFCGGLGLLTIRSVFLFRWVSTYGWTTERIKSDTIKITTDGKYEYRIELVKLFQRNSYERLYFKDLVSSEEKYIPIDYQTHKIDVFGVKEVNYWEKPEPTDNCISFNLYTTKELGIPEEQFKVDIFAGTSKRLE